MVVRSGRAVSNSSRRRTKLRFVLIWAFKPTPLDGRNALHELGMQKRFAVRVCVKAYGLGIFESNFVQNAFHQTYVHYSVMLKPSFIAFCRSGNANYT